MVSRIGQISYYQVQQHNCESSAFFRMWFSGNSFIFYKGFLKIFTFLFFGLSVWTSKSKELLKEGFDCLKPSILNYGNASQKTWERNRNEAAFSFEYSPLKCCKIEVINILKYSFLSWKILPP